MKNEEQIKHKGRALTGIAVQIIATKGNHGRSMEKTKLLDAMTPEVIKHFPEYAEKKDATGYLRWVGQLDTFSSRHAKGIMGKKSREWFLTDEGMRMTHDDKGKPLPVKKIAQRYNKWLGGQGHQGQIADDESGQEGDGSTPEVQLKYQIIAHIRKKGAESREKGTKDSPGQWFEELVAALLRGMGYERVVVTGKPDDGGIDVVAYKDELGADTPRVKVQVKHYNKGQEIRDTDIRDLEEVIHDGEIGMFVTASKFSPKAEKRARKSQKHMELVDIDRFVELWVKYWTRMTNEEDKSMLPLKYALNTDALDTSKEKEAE